MLIRQNWPALLCLPLCVTFLPAATIEGRVTLPKSNKTAVINQRYEIVTKGGVVFTSPPVAVISLEGSFEAPATQPLARVTQKDFTFVPSVLPIRAGTRVEFPNEDDSYHNIFSYSPAKRFDLGRYRPGDRPIPSEVFDKPGLVTLRCDIHEHMRGIILVFDTPHFVMSDPDGNFRLMNLPAGRYTLKAWLNSKTTLEKTVELQADTTLRVDFP